MAELDTTVTLRGIEKIVDQIVQRFRPQKIILFGSLARGTPTEDSDVDLLVVMETEESPLHTAAQIAASIDHPFPIDILVRTPSKWEASLKRGGVFPTEVVVLYEAGDGRVG